MRSPSRKRVTFGALYLGDELKCLTLEDEIRERPGVPVSAWKVSIRFCCVLPRVQNVPGFSGIRIHAGNVIDDTEGCILVGRRVSGRMIAESRMAFRKLMATLERAYAGGDAIAIEIRNP